MEKFTVIIPTLDRCETLAHTLETCVAQQDENFHILISDNLSTDATGEVVREFLQRDRRVEVIQPPNRMGMAAHYEFALSHVHEGFVMLLGSDDGLLPGAMARARACLQAHPDARALHGGMNLYLYPNCPFENAGHLILALAPKHEIRQTRPHLERVARGDEHPAFLPYPYANAWVRVSVLDELAHRTGRRIRSHTPDVYLSIAIASVIEEYIHVCPGFGISGISTKSIGGGALHPQGDRTIEDAFNRENEVPFHPLVTYTRSVDILVGECLLQAKAAGLLPPDFPIAWEKLLARAYVDARRQPWSDAERTRNCEKLLEQARALGCSHVLDNVEQFATLEKWIDQLPFDLSTANPPWEYFKDTRPMGITGVHEAVQLAEKLLLAEQEKTQTQSSDISPRARRRSWLPRWLRW